MGRKKKYDRDMLIKKAIGVFRLHGFAGTSTQMLVDELGVNRFSLYSEFGSKQELFEIVLERYNQDVIDLRFSTLEETTAGLDEIRALLQFYESASRGIAAGRGCLLCNTAVEFGDRSISETDFIQQYFERLSRGFYQALSHADGRGELRQGVDLQAEADFLTTSLLGLLVMIRAKAPQAIIKNATQMTIQHVERLHPSPYPDRHK